MHCGAVWEGFFQNGFTIETKAGEAKKNHFNMGLQSGFRLHCLNLSDTGEAKAEKSPAKRALMSQTLDPLAVLRAEVAASILLLHLLFSCLMGRRVTEVDLGTSLSNRFPISW